MAPDLVGTIPQWLTATGTVALLGVILRHLQVMKRLALGDTADIRDHYAEELKRKNEQDAAREKQFMELERHLREMATLSDERYAECVSERDGLRTDLESLKLQFKAASVDRLLTLEGRPSEIAPHSTAAAKRIKENGGDK